jgi:hypothetical protein
MTGVDRKRPDEFCRLPALNATSEADSDVGGRIKFESVSAKPPFEWKTIPQGAATSVWAAVVAPAEEIGGRYCENCHVGRIVPDTVTISGVSEGVRGYALDPNNAEALWKKSEKLVGETF